jgi:hypothetical protein
MKAIDEHIHDLAQTILTTRDFCGDEQQRLSEVVE